MGGGETHMPCHSPAIALSTLLIPAVAAAQTVEFELDTLASSSTTAFDFAIPFSGTLIGDYDAKTNPDGTQTRPGLFGGSGNNPIDCEITISLSSDPTPTSPSGRIVLDFDGLESSLLLVEELQVDLLAGELGSVGGALGISFESFNTVNPFSIYPGGIPLEIPLAGAQILQSEFVLVEPTTVFAAPGKGEIVFNAIMPVTWIVEFDTGAGAQLQEIPVALPFIGSVSGEPGSRTVRFGGATADAGNQPLDLPVGPIPVPLPTITGDTANLLFSGAVTSVDFSTNLELDAVGVEIESFVPEDLNLDGFVDSADLGLLIANWGLCDDCPADLNGDGVVSSADIGLLIAAWTG